jgi:polyisoprenoid-binding protein YceI
MADNEETLIPAGRWVIDPVHSTVEFQVVDGMGTIAVVRGRFREFGGVVEATSDAGLAHVQGFVRVASLTTDNHERDEHLLSPDVLDAGRFPDIRFSSQRIAREDGSWRILGVIELQGEQRDLELHARVRRVATDRRGHWRIAMAGSAELELAETTATVITELSLIQDH